MGSTEPAIVRSKPSSSFPSTGRFPEPGALLCALQALKRQFIDFRFHYPLEVVPGSGTNTSLTYYLYGDKLSWSALRLDVSGVPQAWYRMTGKQYWPPYVAWYGLVNLGHYLRSRDDAALDVFLNQINWLKNRAVVRKDGSVVWTMNFDYPIGAVTMKAPWVSAFAQGLCISALVRGWRITRDRCLMQLLEGSSKVFTQDHHEGGIRIPHSEGALYTEVPGGSKPGIFDGFLISLLGLHDLFVETGDPEVKQLFIEGVRGLKSWLSSWDYHGKWSWYGSREYLCSPAYHCKNRLLLLVLSEITGDPDFAKVAANWNPDRLNALGRAEIYFTCNWTQSLSRFRHRTWRLRPSRQLATRVNESSGIGTAAILAPPSPAARSSAAAGSAAGSSSASADSAA